MKKCFDAGFAASKNTRGKMLTVVYEQLLMNPERETKQICSFLEIEWNDLMLFPGDKEHLGAQAITAKSNKIWYDSKTYYRNPDHQNIQKWKSKLTLGQQLKIALTFRGNKDLMQCGYDFSIDELTRENYVLSRCYFFYLWLARAIYRFLSVVIRKIPGLSLIRNGLLAVTRLLG